MTVSDWQRWRDSWLNDPLMSINAEDVEKNVNESYKIMHKSVRLFQESPGIDCFEKHLFNMSFLK